MKIKTTTALFLVSLAFGLSSCDKKESKTASATTPIVESEQLDALYLETAPADARQVSAVFADAKPGTEIVLAGEIMGRRNPFVDGRAMFVLGDPTKITPCNRLLGDACKTPWDACCEDPDVIKNAVATIQFLDENGEIIPSGLKGYRGIAEQSFLTVKGTIAEGSNGNNLLVNASGFHAAKESPYKDSAPVNGDKKKEE